MDTIDLSVMRPSLEAAVDWSLKVTKVNQIDKTDMADSATRNLLKVGPALVWIDDTNRHEEFFHEIIEYFRGRPSRFTSRIAGNLERPEGGMSPA